MNSIGLPDAVLVLGADLNHGGFIPAALFALTIGAAMITGMN